MSEREFFTSGFNQNVNSTAAKLALNKVDETFQRLLYIEDMGVVHVVLGAAAAHRLESDPLWLMLVGASSGGKTEALNALNQLPGIYHTSTLTEASLLSGTPKRERDGLSTGGLLREIGAEGVLIHKDFGSVLSMNRDTRAQLMAALREIYDGAWTRNVGTDGGRKLHWEGKLGLIAGVTTAIDTHHAVMATLGERFLLYRLPDVDRQAFASRALDNTGRERQIRDELAHVVGRLFEALRIPEGLLPLTDLERDGLVALADVVASARSAVERDGRTREVELVHDTEAPARLVQALRRMYAGLRIIGLDSVAAWRIIYKTGLDCIPKSRRTVFDLLLHVGEMSTSAIALHTGYPTTSTRRALEDLAAHHITARSKGGRDDAWALTPHAMDALNKAVRPTVPEMSAPLDNAHSTERDISGTVEFEVGRCGEVGRTGAPAVPSEPPRRTSDASELAERRPSGWI